MYHQAWMLVPNQIRGEGGRELERFRGQTSPHDRQNGAEAWIGSVTKANGATQETPNIGCSEVYLPDGTRRYLHEVIRDEPKEVLGESHIGRFGNELGILAKLLDAKAKFLLQCHPSREVAAKHWNSAHGKEECWHVISTREDASEPPYVLLGFKPGVTRESFEHRYRVGDIGGLEDMCHKFIVKPGETYLVPSGMPHALGAGCFVFEIQEPTDLTAVPLKQEVLLEYRRNANPKGAFYAIDDELYEKRILESFVFTGFSRTEIRDMTVCEKKVIRQEIWGRETLLIGSDHTEFFSATLMDVMGSAPIESTGDVRIGLVTSGEGEIISENSRLCVRRGSEVFFPYDVEGTRLCGNFSMIVCNPSAAFYKT